MVKVLERLTEIEKKAWDLRTSLNDVMGDDVHFNTANDAIDCCHLESLRFLLDKDIFPIITHPKHLRELVAERDTEILTLLDDRMGLFTLPIFSEILEKLKTEINGDSDYETGKKRYIDDGIMTC